MRHLWALCALSSLIFTRFSQVFIPITISFFLVTVLRFNQRTVLSFPQWKKAILFPVQESGKKEVISAALKEGQYSLAKKMASLGTKEDLRSASLPDRLAQEESFWASIVQIQPTVSQAIAALGILSEARGDTKVAEKFYSQATWLKPSEN